jgi:isocitrate dehydrogenase
MSHGDFKSNELSVTVPEECTVDIVLETEAGEKKVLKGGLALQKGEVLDATVMSKSALIDFLVAQIADAKDQGVLFSLHMKATMMKVSDPIIFGHAVTTFFADVFAKHWGLFEEIGVDVNNGFGDLLSKIETLPADKKKEIEADIKAAYENGPDLAMVNSDKGITNLHVPADVCGMQMEKPKTQKR